LRTDTANSGKRPIFQRSSATGDFGENVREIGINPIVPGESVSVATARGMRPREAEEMAERDTRGWSTARGATRWYSTTPEAHLACLFQVCQEQMRELYVSDRRLKEIPVCKNFSAAAGASIPTGLQPGSGPFVSTLSPELAAEALRNAEIDD
jgi:hypothetical protein